MTDNFSWSQTGAPAYLIETLNQHGETRFVGGCVRDSLRGFPPGLPGRTDIDMATTLHPESVIDVLTAESIRCIPTGIEHGTVTAVIESVPFEITTLRSDVITDGRHAEVVFGTDWIADAERRDFTMNALYLDAKGNIHDPTKGLRDLERHQVKFIGDARKRIREDYLRILRFLRFSARFAEDVEHLDWKACIQEKEGLQSLSKERIWMEVAKIFRAKGAPHILTIAANDGVLHEICPKDADPETFTRIHFHSRQDVSEALGVVSLWPTIDVEMMKRCFKPSNQVIDAVIALKQAVDFGRAHQGTQESLYRFGRTATKEATFILMAEELKSQRDLSHALSLDIPILPISGADIVGKGVAPGPMVGKILKAFEQTWIEEDFQSEADYIHRTLTNVIARI